MTTRTATPPAPPVSGPRLQTDLSWQEQGACTGLPVEWWFPPNHVRSPSAHTTCLTCPVRTQCLNYALDNRERWGIWGGLTWRQRRPILAARDEAAGIIRWCRYQRHVMTAANTTNSGSCRACKREYDTRYKARMRRAAA